MRNLENTTGRRVIYPVTDIREEEHGYVLLAEIPGVPSEDVSLTVEDRTMILEAEPQLWDPAGYEVVRREVPPLRYRAVFEMPDRVDATKISSRLENGVLSVKLPMREEAKPRRIAVAAKA